MIRIVVVCISIFLSSTFVLAQSTLERYEVSSTGQDITTIAGRHFSYTVGGVVVQTAATSSGKNYTQGFEQPNLVEDGLVRFNPPNAFSPDGDGINETWIINVPAKFLGNIDVVIVNRWGDEVARIEDYDNMTNVWDGTYSQTGQPAVSGTYFYVVESQEFTKKFSGWVQIVRD